MQKYEFLSILHRILRGISQDRFKQHYSRYLLCVYKKQQLYKHANVLQMLSKKKTPINHISKLLPEKFY